MKNWVFPNPFRFMLSVARTTWAKLRGYEILATPGERDERLDQCDWCDELSQSQQCRVCSCFVLAKAALALESCPKKKWRAIWRRKKSALTKSGQTITY